MIFYEKKKSKFVHKIKIIAKKSKFGQKLKLWPKNQNYDENK